MSETGGQGHGRTGSASTGGIGSSSPFAGWASASALQHAATHLSFTSSPSLTGELLRASVSDFLRTQVAYVTQVVVLYGFNEHQWKAEDDIPIAHGKLCYAALTQCELVLIDRQALGGLSLSPVAVPYEELMKAARAGPQQMLQCTPFHVLHKVRVDSDREDQFTLVLRDDRGLGFPACLVLSSVHRKAFCEQLMALYNAHFQFIAMMPDASAAISAAAQAALLSHTQVASSHLYATQGLGPAEGPSSLSSPVMLDPLLHAGGALSLNRHMPTNRFSVLTTSSNYSSTLGRTRRLQLDFENTQTPFKHPSEQFFAALPSKFRGNIFHRCGYMFAARKPPAVRFGARPPPGGPTAAGGEEIGEWVDQAALFLNRRTATYRYQCASDGERNIPLHQRKFLQVTVCPEKAISPFSCTVKSRDFRGQTPGRAAGKATMRELLRGCDTCDDDDFHLWTYSVARAVAMNECRLIGSSDYSEPQCKVYMKKINVVGDKSSWVCYQVHIRTQTREIGLIACRRKFLPPYFDTFQDLVFVLYGACAPNNQPLAPAPPGVFMAELEMVVDTLSPTVVPLPFHYARGLSLSIIHPTYADLTALQGRMNALLFNSMSYHWLSTRAWITSTRGEFGVIPTTEFLGSACFKLARSFANSILVRVTHRRERVVWAEYLPVAIEGIGAENVEEVVVAIEGGEEGVEKDKEKQPAGAADKEKEGEKEPDKSAAAQTTETPAAATAKHAIVSDPLVIVSRMLTEFAATEAATRRKLGPQLTAYSAEEEWRCRVSQYLSYCVDDGIFPGALNIKRLLSVLTRAFLDAPILSAETSIKLDRVVDFLLYMKRRVGPPIVLPSWKQAAESVAATSASRLGNRAAAGLRAHQAKAVTSAATNQQSPFASLTASSPQPFFQEVHPDHAGAFDYDESTTLLQKLRDPALLANFTCNEHMMIALLDTSYIESLEKATIGTAMYQEGSVIPALLASLLTKDYNIDLIRAVRDKIISYEIHHELLIAPLIALLKDGTMQTSHYALHSLTMLSRFHPRAVVEAGGASLAMWLIFMSKNELLLAASIDLVLVLFSDDTRAIFAQPLFAMKLVDLLRTRVGGARYHNLLLQKTSALIFQLAKIPELLHIFLASYAHRELVHIIGEDEKRPILLDTSVCLGQLFVNAKNKMLTTPSENAQEHASVLVQTMAKCTTRPQLRIALNLLVALQLLIRLPKAYYNRISNTMSKPGGGVQFTAPDKAFESRVLVLQHLHTREGLENVLDRASASADAELNHCEAQLRAMNALEEIPTASGKPKIRLLAPEGDTRDPQSTAARTLELIELHTIATNVNKNTRWFKMRMNYAVAALWNINTLWQKDKRTFLAVPSKE